VIDEMTNENLNMTYPGSELIPNPRKIITNSVIIKASPEKIWPWLIQLGSGRAGWYLYDKIDNGGVPSARKIISELQPFAMSGHYIMESRMLQGIKKRVESNASD
jgi:proline iminopeptidase